MAVLANKYVLIDSVDGLGICLVNRIDKQHSHGLDILKINLPLNSLLRACIHIQSVNCVRSGSPVA